jgi:triosephosphate isomerase
MRKPLVAGNWKMNKTFSEAVNLVTEMLPALTLISQVDQVLCPPFTSLMAISTLIAETEVQLGAQNMHWENSGAFTGEVSPQMVKEFCRYIIIGHSERRAYFGETDQTVNKKVRAALAHKIIPIICIGETLEENEASQTESVLTRQIKQGLAEVALAPLDSIVIAYEPIWAIGTGKAASGETANKIIGEIIRPNLKAVLGHDVSVQTRILYGGSVTPANAREFFSQPEIDGALVGGASLKTDFTKIVEAAIP